jgi:hypothetical protein
VVSLWLRVPLGVVCLGASGALLMWNGEALLTEMGQTGGGLSLLNFGGLMLGTVSLGASADCFGLMPRVAEKEKQPKNTLVHGAAAPASEHEAQAAARGDAKKAPMHDATFPN